MLSLLTNTSASVAQRNLGQTNANISSSLEKLSSGLRVNKASDDVASMAIGSRLNSELTALRTVATNAGQAVSLLQIAEGVYSRTNDMLVRMKSLAAQAANGTLSDTERQLLDVEYQALQNEITRVANDTTFNGSKLVEDAQTDDNGAQTNGTVNSVTTYNVAQGTHSIVYTAGTRTFAATIGGVAYTGTIDASFVNGTALTKDIAVELSGNNGNSSIVLELDSTFDSTDDAVANDITSLDVTDAGGNAFNFRVGSGSNSSEDVIAATITGATATALGINGSAITTINNADLASMKVDAAINMVIGARASVGAAQNRVETARTNLATTIENTEAAKSSYLDSDVASEITKFTSQQILLQSGISTLAQANQIPQNLLSLFQ